jgi:hypothetical protein
MQSLGLLLLGFSIVAAQTVADIDIKPGSDVNPINVKSRGKTSVAIMCVPGVFDPALIIPSSVMLGAASALHCELEDVNADGCLDLVCHVNTHEIGVACEDSELTLVGVLTNGTTITGTDTIRPVPCRGHD